jgi:hypothetical protein
MSAPVQLIRSATVFAIKLEATQDIDSIRELRRLLKVLLRSFSLRCIAAREERSDAIICRQRRLHQSRNSATQSARRTRFGNHLWRASMPQDTKSNLPTTRDDGFNDAEDGRVIRGVIAKFVDGNWTDSDGAAISADKKLLAWSTTQCLQRWENKKPVEVIVKRPGVSLPDVDELNNKIPTAKWEMGLNGPRPPWTRQFVVHLLDPQNASQYTFISGTTGAAIATERLRDRIKNMRLLRGDRVAPIVTLDSRPMPTRFGIKQRPEFTIQGWQTLGGPAPTPAIAHIKEPTLSGELNDSIPDFDAKTPDPPAKKIAAKS